MLATAGESSSPKGANKSSVATGKRSKLDILADVVKPKPPAEQKKVAESIAKELSHWEKVVFSFDMERDTGRSASNSGQRRNEQDSTNPRRQTQQGVSRSSSSSGSFPSQSQSFPDPLGEQGGHFPPFGQLPNISGQQQQYHHQIGAPGLGGLDPYVLQQLAAISALSGPPPQESHQHQGDPFAALRNIQGASQHSSPDAIANLFRGFPPGPPGSSQVPPANLPLPPGIHNPALLNSPAGLQWLAQVQSMGLQRPQPHSQMPPSLQGHPGHGPGQSQQRPIAPLTFPGTSISPQTQVQTPGAGPSRSRHSTAGSSSGGSSRAPSASSPSPVNTTAPTLRGQQDMDEAAIAEDKRRRNTAASGTFIPPPPPDVPT